MAFDAGKIEGTLDLDRSPFQRELAAAKEDARRFAQGKFKATIEADTKPADAQIIYLKDRLAQLDRTRVTPRLSVDNAAGLVKLVDFNDRLDALRSKIATARVDVDDTAARAKLDALDLQLRRVGTITSRPKVTLEGVERANIRLDALSLKLAALDHSSGSGTGGGGLLSRLGGSGFFGGIGPLAVAGGAAAVPLGVGALGLGASFLTPTIAGAAGLGLFGAASRAAVTRVDKVQEQLDKLNQRISATAQTRGAGSPAQIAAAQLRLQAAEQRLAAAQAGHPTQLAGAQSSVTSAQASLTRLQGGTANPEYDKLVQQRERLLKQLTPAEREAAKGVDGLKESWKGFQRAVEPQTFALIATGSRIATRGLHDLRPMTVAVGDEIDHMAVKAKHALTDPFWQHFFHDFLTVEAPRAVHSLFETGGNVVTGFAHLAEDFAPLGHRLEDDFVRWSSIFDRWTQGTGPERFVALVERDGPIAAHALEALASGLGGLLRGLEPIGRIELQALTPVLNFIGELGKQHPAVITALGAAYLTVAGGLKAIAAVKSIQTTLEGTTSGLGSVRRMALLTAGAIGVVEIGKHSAAGTGGAIESTLGGALTGLAAGFFAFGPEGAVVGAVAGGLGALTLHMLSTGTEVQSLTAQVDALAGSLQTALGLDKGLIGGNVKRQIQQELTTNPDFTKPGKFGLNLLDTLTKYGVTEDQLINYVGSGFKNESPQLRRVIAGATRSGNSTFLDQIAELFQSIEQALKTYKNLGSFTGSAKGGGKSGSGSTTSSVDNNSPMAVAGGQAGQVYTTNVAASIVAHIPKVEQAVATLAQRLNAKLKSLQSQERQTAQSITQSLLGSVGLAALGSTADSLGAVGGIPLSAVGVITGLENQRKAIQRFDRELSLEHKRGLSARVEQQIASLGLDQGGALANALASATPAQLRHISQLTQVVNRTATGVGHDLAHDIFGERLDNLTRALHEVQRTIHDAAHRHRTLTDADWQRLQRILNDALAGNPVQFNDRHHRHKRGAAVLS